MAKRPSLDKNLQRLVSTRGPGWLVKRLGVSIATLEKWARGTPSARGRAALAELASEERARARRPKPSAGGGGRKKPPRRKAPSKKPPRRPLPPRKPTKAPARKPPRRPAPPPPRKKLPPIKDRARELGTTPHVVREMDKVAKQRGHREPTAGDLAEAKRLIRKRAAEKAAETRRKRQAGNPKRDLYKFARKVSICIREDVDGALRVTFGGINHPDDGQYVSHVTVYGIDAVLAPLDRIEDRIKKLHEILRKVAECAERYVDEKWQTYVDFEWNFLPGTGPGFKESDYPDKKVTEQGHLMASSPPRWGLFVKGNFWDLLNEWWQRWHRRDRRTGEISEGPGIVESFLRRGRILYGFRIDFIRPYKRSGGPTPPKDMKPIEDVEL